MEVLIFAAVTTVNIVAAYYLGKTVSGLKYQKKICRMMTDIVRENNKELKNCDGEKAYRLLASIEKTKESLRIYDKVIDEFKNIDKKT